MGTVYLAEQLGLNREVAIKILHESASDAESEARFMREGQVLARLEHPNIVSVYGFGVSDNRPYLIMEYLQGKSLSKFIDDGACEDWNRASAIFLQICRAMEYAHEKNVVHRDLKPSNIIILDGSSDQIKIIDFGLATFLDSSASGQKLTATGLLIGSARYMSPEQCQGKKADHRSDIYSAACILYEMLTSNPPFEADSSIGLLHKHSTEQAPSVFERGANKTVPAEIDLVLQKAMTKDPDQRYQSFSVFKKHVEMLTGKNTVELPEELRQLALSSKKGVNRRQFRIIYACSTLIVILLCSFAYSLYGVRKKEIVTADSYIQEMKARRSQSKYVSRLDELKAAVLRMTERSQIRSAIEHVQNWIARRKRARYALSDTLSEEVAATCILADLYSENMQQPIASALLQDSLDSLGKDPQLHTHQRLMLLSSKLRADSWTGDRANLLKTAAELQKILKVAGPEKSFRVCICLAMADAYDGAGEFQKALKTQETAMKDASDATVQSMIYHSMAHIYYRLHQPEKAQKCVRDGYLRIAEKDKQNTPLEQMQGFAAAQAGCWKVAADLIKPGLARKEISDDTRAKMMRDHAEWQLNTWGSTSRNQGPHRDRHKQRDLWLQDLASSEVEFARAADLAYDVHIKRKCLIWLAGTQFAQGKDAEAKRNIDKACLLKPLELSKDVRGSLANEMWAQGSLYSSHDFYPECIPIFSSAVDLYAGSDLPEQESRARLCLSAALKNR